jgi:manganese/zinc/iron transport system permease protein
MTTMAFFSYTVVVVLAGSTMLGIMGGVLGCFTLLRRQSLLGDALAHAALPGVCVAFLLTGSKGPIPLLLGALGAGIAGSLLILAVVRGSRVKEDAAIGIVLSTFFGAGIVLLTRIQKLPGGNQSGLDKFLFGQAAALVGLDLVLMGSLGAAVLLAIALGFKEWKLLSFDRAFGASLGFPMRGLEIALTCLLVLVVVIGLQTVGVVLMVATLVTPAAAARQWTDRLSTMALLSALIGGASGAIGAFASASIERLPTGPTIVLVSSVALVVSLFLAPNRGLLWAAVRVRRFTSRICRENLLKDVYLLGERGTGHDAYVSRPALMGQRGQGSAELERHARPLVRAGLVERSGDALRLTEGGLDEAARVVRKHRLWEVYLAHRLELPADHVHRDAEAMEHALSEEAVDDIDFRLGFPATDPHGRPIPRRRKTGSAAS